MVTTPVIQEAISNFTNCNADIIILDDYYSLPAVGWITNNFSLALAENLKIFKSDKYIKERNDCDDFAFLSMSLAKISHKMSTSKNTGLAFGVFMYEIDNNGGGHAINFAVVKVGRNYELVFFEPQTQKEVFLTASERKSCFAYVI